MAFNDSSRRVRHLVKLASEIQHIIRYLCGAGDGLTTKAANLVAVLLRLEKEAAKSHSPLNRHGDMLKEDLTRLSDDCQKTLNDTASFLSKYRALTEHERRLLDSQETIFFNDRHKDVSLKLWADFNNYAFEISLITVEASMSLIGQLEADMFAAGYTLRMAVNRVTADLLANNNPSITMVARHPGGRTTLWKELQRKLLTEGLSGRVVNQHRERILTYVKALVESSASEDSAGASTSYKGDSDRPPGGCSGDCDTYHHEDDEGFIGKTPSRKRTRSDGDESRQTRRDTKTDSFQSPTQPERNTIWVPSDPRQVFRSFWEREGSELPDGDDDTLTKFLNEKLSFGQTQERLQQLSLRDQVRAIYRSLSFEYEPQYKALLSERFSEAGQCLNDYVVLIHGIDYKVINKMDELHHNDDTDLRAIRKKIIDKANRILEDLEVVKEGLVD